MFSTSSDILNLVLAICVILLTFFLCWAIFYLVVSLHRIHRLAKKAQAAVAKAEEVVEIAKSKLKKSGTYFMLLGEIAKKAMEFVEKKRAAKKR